MAYFNEDFLAFFKELSKNNNKAWFDLNRKRYETSVKDPFKAFADEMIERLREIEPMLDVQAKDVIFRINRDIRFAKDKTPYKTHLGANIARGGRKGVNSPGYYYQFSFDKISLGAGAHHLNNDGIEKIRKEIADEEDKFIKLINDKKFIKSFGSIKGERNKRLPKEYKEIEQKIPYIANKEFFYMKKLDSSNILSDDLSDILMDYFNVAKDLNHFFRAALQEK